MIGAIVVMGVSGAGKSTLGAALAQALRCPFVEGDTLHPPANIAKMAAGIPLEDIDRQPFLERVAQVCREREATGVVISCSALKRRYRDLIRSRAAHVLFVLPLLSRQALGERLANRHHPFMPASLLDSQLAALEQPGTDEEAVILDGAASIENQVRRVLAALSNCGA